MSINHQITRNQTHFELIPKTAIVPKQKQIEHEPEEDLDLENVGELAECEDETLRYNRLKFSDSQQKTYPKQNRRPIHE